MLYELSSIHVNSIGSVWTSYSYLNGKNITPIVYLRNLFDIARKTSNDKQTVFWNECGDRLNEMILGSEGALRSLILEPWSYESTPFTQRSQSITKRVLQASENVKTLRYSSLAGDLNHQKNAYILFSNFLFSFNTSFKVCSLTSMDTKVIYGFQDI